MEYFDRIPLWTLFVSCNDGRVYKVYDSPLVIPKYVWELICERVNIVFYYPYGDNEIYVDEDIFLPLE
jgi:hypothetical protein